MIEGAETVEFENKREHFRVEMLVPVRWQILSEEETGLVKKGMGSTLFREKSIPSPIDEFLEQAAPGSEQEQFYRSLQYINNKLDFVIEQLISKSLENQPAHDDVIEISASGLKFTSSEYLDTGIFLKMNLILPGTFQYQMNFIAEVMRVEEKNNGYITAARVVHIDEDARDSIVKVIFQKQRVDIRTKKAEEKGIIA